MLTKILACGAAIAVLPSVAMAQGYYREVRGPVYAEPYAGPYEAAPRGRVGGVCHRWCPSDHNPCDPANFKIADGRCKPPGIIRD